jgi:hypothetical protein
MTAAVHLLLDGRARRYYLSFFIIVTLVFFNMIVAIIFDSYGSLSAEIAAVQEVNVLGDFVKTMLIGRQPSLHEQMLTPMETVVGALHRGGFWGVNPAAFKRWRERWWANLCAGTPCAARDRTHYLSAETFNDKFLFQLLDPDQYYSRFGLVSHELVAKASDA